MLKLRKFSLLTFCLALLSLPAYAQEETSPQIRSITLEGGPIYTKHFQSGRDNYREKHGLGILKVDTKDYGNWALYLLSPNSVDRQSFGLGYVTTPYVVPLGFTELELGAALGLVTGYQDFPVPLIAGQARLKLYEQGAWNAGISVAANPYIMEEKNTGDHKWGAVLTSPFLSVRYSFD